MTLQLIGTPGSWCETARSAEGQECGGTLASRRPCRPAHMLHVTLNRRLKVYTTVSSGCGLGTVLERSMVVCVFKAASFNKPVFSVL